MDSKMKWILALGVGAGLLWWMKKKAAGQVRVAPGTGVVSQTAGGVTQSVASAQQNATDLFTLALAFERLGLDGYFDSAGNLLVTPQVLLTEANAQGDSLTDDERMALVSLAKQFGVPVSYA